MDSYLMKELFRQDLQDFLVLFKEWILFFIFFQAFRLPTTIRLRRAGRKAWYHNRLRRILIYSSIRYSHFSLVGLNFDR
jgi:hypothetical protein